MTQTTEFKSAYQIAAELRSQKVGKIFDAIDGDYVYGGHFDYSPIASAIMEMVMEAERGFVADICKRYSAIDNRYPMSDKQRWCIAFAFAKVSDEVVNSVINRANC
jgi:hypothetical protein